MARGMLATRAKSAAQAARHSVGCMPTFTSCGATVRQQQQVDVAGAETCRYSGARGLVCTH